MNKFDGVIKYTDEITKNYKIADRVKKAVKLIGKGNKILDIGCRIGEVTNLFAEGNEVTGIDVVPEFIERIKKKVNGKFLVFDLDSKQHLPFASKSFDVVFIGEVLEHIHYPLDCLKESYRVLKDDGRIIICGQNESSLRKRLRRAVGKNTMPDGFYTKFLTHWQLKYWLYRAKFDITQWINEGTRVMNVKLPFAFEDSCDVWIVEAKK